VQKKNDPLLILVEGKAEIRCKIGYLSRITANLTNLDCEKAPVGLTVGGDYRGASRHNKWRLQISDSEGHALPEKQDFDMGGFIHSETLKFGESLSMTTSIGNYVTIEKPGAYTMVVLYHSGRSIGTLPGVDGLICYRSIPIELIVEPIEVETTDAEQKLVAELILELPRNEPARILSGTYSEDSAGTFMPKGSPAGRLMQMKWKAVPALIAAVNGGQLNATQRAWALGMLFSITGQHDPMDVPGALGPFEYRHSGGVSTDGFGGGSFGQGSLSVPSGRIDPAVQLDLAKRWKPWLENHYIQIKKLPDPEAQPARGTQKA